jgi:hypothetical protein
MKNLFIDHITLIKVILLLQTRNEQNHKKLKKHIFKVLHVVTIQIRNN